MKMNLILMNLVLLISLSLASSPAYSGVLPAPALTTMSPIMSTYGVTGTTQNSTYQHKELIILAQGDAANYVLTGEMTLLLETAIGVMSEQIEGGSRLSALEISQQIISADL